MKPHSNLIFQRDVIRINVMKYFHLIKGKKNEDAFKSFYYDIVFSIEFKDDLDALAAIKTLPSKNFVYYNTTNEGFGIGFKETIASMIFCNNEDEKILKVWTYENDHIKCEVETVFNRIEVERAIIKSNIAYNSPKRAKKANKNDSFRPQYIGVNPKPFQGGGCSGR